MKGIFAILVIIGMIGYTWYADILPFGTANNSVKLTPTVENIWQIPNVLVSNENQIISYSFQSVPEIPDKEIPINALEKAIATWESNNPQLKFVESENSNIEIKWQEYSSPTHTGLATCNSVLFGILSHCVLNISVGAVDCNDDFIQNDENMVANILMHEIGHALKLGHTNETGHLMYSYESPQNSFDNRGYGIPQRFEELYIGQKLLLEQEKEMRNEIESLGKKLSDEKLLYDKHLKEYQYYEDKTLSSVEYRTATTLFENLKGKTDKINDIIKQQNNLIDKVNEIVNQLGCNPNFKISQ
ncbi:matrixin family metalloprotease [Nitrosopumilus ureiphilus]|uniref:Peptidase n=1 Tax=Nitrosopumilus ureiphilus TaxID=1470067 RepID=A0A7D5M497_9ARCH|nr:matrixin family metalloprotease [Nitrosopumilus ureiphilus]QLH06786.1 peptidase [Nitrosopumilus ureiphilus]